MPHFCGLLTVRRHSKYQHMPRATKQSGFAVVRVDTFQSESVPLVNRVTVKEIVFSREVAEREVARLSKLNAAKGCEYFVAPTRVAPRLKVVR